MFCRNCGAEVNKDEAFCSYCGERLREPEAEVVDPVTITTQKNNEARKSELASKALLYGILSVAFCEFPILSILAIIFGNLAKKYAGMHQNEFGYVLGKAGVGRGLGIGGTIAGIVMTVIWAIYFIYFAAFIGVAMGM